MDRDAQIRLYLQQQQQRQQLRQQAPTQSNSRVGQPSPANGPADTDLTSDQRALNFPLHQFSETDMRRLQQANEQRAGDMQRANEMHLRQQSMQVEQNVNDAVGSYTRNPNQAQSYDAAAAMRAAVIAATARSRSSSTSGSTTSSVQQSAQHQITTQRNNLMAAARLPSGAPPPFRGVQQGQFQRNPLQSSQVPQLQSQNQPQTQQQNLSQQQPTLSQQRVDVSMYQSARPDAAAFFQKASSSSNVGIQQQRAAGTLNSVPVGTPGAFGSGQTTSSGAATIQRPNQIRLNPEQMAGSAASPTIAGNTAPAGSSGPQATLIQLLERIKSERERAASGKERNEPGNGTTAFERSRKRPLENEEKLFWDKPLPARQLAGLTLLESDISASLISQRANDIWLTVDKPPSNLASLTNNKFFSTQEYLYTECSLSGLIDEEKNPGALSGLCGALASLADLAQKGVWKDECWRRSSESDLGGGGQQSLTFLESSNKSAREVWIRRILRSALRVYSPQYLAVPAKFPANARRVKETTTAPSITSILGAVGFQRALPNDAFVKGILYHIDAGTNRHILVVISRIYSNREMTAEIAPHKILVEAKSRTESDFLVNSVASALNELAQKLKQYVHLVKV